MATLTDSKARTGSVRPKSSKPAGRIKAQKLGWGSPIVYFVSLCLIAICIAPVLYMFRTL